MGRLIGNLFSGIAGVFSRGSEPTAAPSVSPTPVPIVATTLPPVQVVSSVQEQHENRCIFDMSMACLTCDQPPPMCTAFPTELAFRYTGGSCDQNRNAQQDSNHPHVHYFCLDFIDSEDDKLEEVYVVATGLKDNAKLYEGRVKLGDVVKLTNGGDLLPPNHMIKVFRDENVRAPNSIVQAVQYHSSCALGLLSIGDAFGAFSVTSFTNEDQGRVSPMRNQTVEITLSTQYDDLGNVEFLEANSNIPPGHYSIPEPVGTRISAFRDLVQWFEVPTDLSTKVVYDLTAHIALFNENTQNSCVGETATRFRVGGAPDPPTEAPTAPPTSEPTASPTDAPTAPPTDEPTSPPTNAPTSPPTDAPTSPPTDAPTGPPTDAPTDSPTDAPTDPPSGAPTELPTDAPTAPPSDTPTASPTEAPTDEETMPPDEEMEPATEPTPAPSMTMPPYYYDKDKALEPTPYPSETWNPFDYDEKTRPPFYYSRPAPVQAPYYSRPAPVQAPYMYNHTEAPYMHHYPTHWGDHDEYPYNPELCMLSTEVECTTSSGESCYNYKISFPTAPVCLDRRGAIELEFMLTGFSCGYHGGFGFGEFEPGQEEQDYETECWDNYRDENRMHYEMQVFVQIYDHGGELFYKKVTLGDTIRLRGPFKSEHLTVVISSARNGYPEEELQVMEGLYIGCSGDWSDLTMNRDYGALQLVGFTTPSQGRQSMVETFTYTTTIQNRGSDTVKLTSAQAFVFHMPHAINVTDCPIGLGPGAAITAKTNVSVNMASVMGWGFGVEVYTSAQGQKHSYCSDSARVFVDVPYVETPPPKTLAPTGLPTCYHVPSPTKEPIASGSTGQGEVDDIREIVRPVAYHRGREWYSETYQARAINWLEEDKYSYGLSAERIQQRYALACIFFATNAVRTVYTVVEPRGWIDSTGWVGGGSECEWFGIVCDSNFMVESIVLASNRLTGSFPVEAGILASSLKKLDLYRNSIYNSGREGHEFLERLYNLETLHYGQTKFEYPGLPPYIARMTNLIEYDCSHTLYSGPIDGWIFEGLQNLEYLVLSGNTFNSSIPEELAFARNLQFFYAQDAALTGDLSFLYRMPSIIELWVDRNPGLGGVIAPWIEEVATLQSLSISDCALTGTIPAQVGSLRNMVRLWLHDNNLSGSIPNELGNLFKLQTLELQGNYLSGVMPRDVCTNVVPEGFLQTLEVDCGQVSCSCCTNCHFTNEVRLPQPVKQSQPIFDKPISYWP